MDKLARTESRGVTLPEVLVVLVVAGVLQTVGAPALASLMDAMRVGRGGESLFLTLQQARSEAIKRNGRVVVCKSDDGARCVTAGGWEQGWLMFQDGNNNARLDAGEAVLLHQAALGRQVRLSGNSQVANYVSYTPTGNASLISGAFQAGTFTICRQSSVPLEARQVVLSSSGRVRSQRVRLSQCA
jgi:type IV fimbrial biogenesis protein FimT